VRVCVCVCVCSSYLVDGNGVQQPAALCEYLCAAGINTVVSGHTPHGDAPNPMDTQAAGGSALRVLSAVRADHTPHTTHHTPHTTHGDSPNPMDTQAAGGSALRVLSAVRADGSRLRSAVLSAQLPVVQRRRDSRKGCFAAASRRETRMVASAPPRLELGVLARAELS
jgi:hypothetical protein